MRVNAGVAAWCATAILTVGLGVSFTLARRTVLGHQVVRWLLVICLAGATEQVVNYYTDGSGTTDLIWIIGPILGGAAVAEYRFRAGRRHSGTSSADSHPGQTG